jgi:hypothetical protein
MKKQPVRATHGTRRRLCLRAQPGFALRPNLGFKADRGTAAPAPPTFPP